jgi:hypothetical protein
MGKNSSKKQHESGKSLSTQSFFGSHASMVVDHKNLPLIVRDGKVVCQDENPGLYITDTSSLDSGLADPNRYSAKRHFVS